MKWPLCSGRRRVLGLPGCPEGVSRRSVRFRGELDSAMPWARRFGDETSCRLPIAPPGMVRYVSARWHYRHDLVGSPS